MVNRDLDIRIEFEEILDQDFVIYSHLAKKLSEIFLKTYSLPDSYDLILESFESVLTPEMGYCRPLVEELINKAFEIIKKKNKK